MESTLEQLRAAGWDVVWQAEGYARATLAGRDMILRWTGQRWVTL